MPSAMEPVAILTILQSPALELLNIKVFRSSASFEDGIRQIAEGVRLAVEKRARVIQLCVGDPRPCGEAHKPPCGEAHKPMCDAVGGALGEGVEVVIAGEARCPAECDERSINVAEIDLRIAESAGKAHRPDFSAPSPGVVQSVRCQDWEVQQSSYEEGS